MRYTRLPMIWLTPTRSEVATRTAFSPTTIKVSSEEALALLYLLDRDPSSWHGGDRLDQLAIVDATRVLREVRDLGTGPMTVERETPLIAVCCMTLTLRYLSQDYEENCEASGYPGEWPLKCFSHGRLRALDRRLSKYVIETYEAVAERYKAVA